MVHARSIGVQLGRRFAQARPFRALPSGAITVGAGLAVSGVSAYAFLALASHTLSPSQYASLATLWSLTFLIWPGSFVALEREVARRVASAKSFDLDDRRHMGDVYRFGAVLTAVALIVVVISHSYLSHLFGREDWLTVDLAIAGPTIAFQFIVLGIFAGNSDFTGYSLVLALEGASRLALGGVLILLALHTAGPLGLALATAPLIAVLAVVKRLRRCNWKLSGIAIGAATPLIWSLASNLCLSALVNSGPVLVRIIGRNQPAAIAGKFLSALVIVRIPIFLYAAASGPLMPALVESATRHDWSAFRQTLKRLVILVIALGGAAVPAAALAGPHLMSLVFGKEYVLDSASLALMAGTSGLLILGSTLSVALTATGAVRYMFISWLSGIAVLGISCLIPLDVIRRVELALLFGSIVPSCVMAVGLFGRRAPVARRFSAAVAIQSGEI